MRDADVALRIAGQAWGGWMGLRVTRGIERTAGDFELETTELWPGGDGARRIEPGQACELVVAGEPVVTGWLDTFNARIDAVGHSVSVSGRDATADLLDCSAVRKPGQWSGQPVSRIAADLAAPFGVRVLVQADEGSALGSFALQEGESVIDAIDRAARLRGLLLTTDGRGALVLTRAGLLREDTPLVLGSNVLRLSVSIDERDRYSDYVAKGQVPGTDNNSGAQAAQVSGRARDPGVARWRPLVITGDSAGSSGALVQRAQWEASVRRAKATRVVATVTGWHNAQGRLWQANRLVHVVAPAMRIDADLLIAEVTLTLDERGSTCTMTMTLPDAYTPEPIAPPAPARARGQPWPWDLTGTRR